MKLSWHEKMLLDAAFNVIKAHLPDKITAAIDIGYNGSFVTFHKDRSEFFAGNHPAFFMLGDKKLSQAFNEYMESLDD